MTYTKPYPVAIIGAGPVGLAAAAHLATRKIPFFILESGTQVGSNILSWSHVRVFSPWQYNIDKAAKELLQRTLWQEPHADALPTGQALVDEYLAPLASLNEIHPFLHLNSKVIAIGRKGLDKMKSANRTALPFVLKIKQGEQTRLMEASAVIDASGTWQKQNPIGSGGMPAIGEDLFQHRIFYGIPNLKGELHERYQNKHVLVVGGGHSAINTILELNQLRQEYPFTRISWVMRKQHIHEILGGKEKDALEARGALGIKIEKLIQNEQVDVYTPFQIQELQQEPNGQLTVIGTQNGRLGLIPHVDEIIGNTGSRPDLSFLHEVRVAVDPVVESVPALADLIDPNKHSCGTVRPHGELELQQPEKDFYVVGMKSYGRAPTFLMATGYEQVRSIVAALDGDLESARRVELDLPETGVCSVDQSGGVACCSV